jgi:hypothetical protein
MDANGGNMDESLEIRISPGGIHQELGAFHMNFVIVLLGAFGLSIGRG